MRALALGSLVLMAACGGSTESGPASPTGPTSTITPTPPTAAIAAGWQGAVTATRRTQSGPLDTTQSFEGMVTFEPGQIADYEPPDDLSALVPGDATVYLLKPGLLRLTHSGNVGPCSYGTSSWDVLMKKGDGFLAVRPNGLVLGRITLPDTSFPVTVICPGVGGATGSTGVQMNLAISGTVVSSRASGTMPPATYGASTFTGTWNLTAR
jgi:hypothetical protein